MIRRKYSERLAARPLSTLDEEEFETLKQMDLLYKIYPDAPKEYTDISLNEFKAGKLKRKKD